MFDAAPLLDLEPVDGHLGVVRGPVEQVRPPDLRKRVFQIVSSGLGDHLDLAGTVVKPPSVRGDRTGTRLRYRTAMTTSRSTVSSGTVSTHSTASISSPSTPGSVASAVVSGVAA